MTKTAFLDTYRALVVARYPWAQDAEKLERFMSAVHETVTTTRNPWAHDNTAAKDAWNAIGGKGKPTLKGLRSLA